MSVASPPRSPRVRSPKRPANRAPAARAGGDRAQEMLAGVRAAGLKLTPQRIAIVRELADDPSHPTAQQIFDRLRSSMPTMSFATVYNTLDALARANLCGALSLSPGAARFDPNMTPHHHAVCDGCGLVRDVERWPDASAAPEIDRALGRRGDVPALSGFEVRAVEHIYRGLCATCAAREKSRSASHRRSTR